mmetsp:Transcript_5538/g.8029  ORF Transcript_5538/g.8029 Transcript_5538/m.8029 type:complete len:83 (+) Transcript_5538:145-393(+)
MRIEMICQQLRRKSYCKCDCDESIGTGIRTSDGVDKCPERTASGNAALNNDLGNTINAAIQAVGNGNPSASFSSSATYRFCP